MKKNLLKIGLIGLFLFSTILITGCEDEIGSEEVSKEFVSKFKKISVKNLNELLLISEGKTKKMLMEREEICKYSSIEPIFKGATDLRSRINENPILIKEKDKVLIS